MFSTVALTISGSMVFSIVVKATVLLCLAFAGVHLARRVRASVRHAVLVSLFAALLALPAAAVFGPLVAIGIVSPEIPHAISPLRWDEDASVVDSQVRADASANDVPGRPLTLAAWMPWATIWAAGTLLCLMPLGIGVWRLRRTRRSGVPWLEGQVMVRRVATAAGIHRRVDVLLHEDAMAPLTGGCLLPVIVLPTDVHTWTGHELKQALVHELEHVRRRDWVIRIVARTICALYWFHPLVWAAWRRLNLEAERACDDAVVIGTEPTAYAQQLVTLARRLSVRAARPTLGMANRTDLSARVAAVLDGAQPRGRVGVLGVIGIVATAVLLMAIVSPLRAIPALPSQSLTPDVKSPMFEVASIKRSTASGNRNLLGIQPGGRLIGTNVTVRQLIRMAYGGARTDLPDAQLVGGPSWIAADRFDVVAKAGEEATGRVPARPQLLLMLQALLRERVLLMTHREPRELSFYALVMARTDGRRGPQLHQSTLDCTQRNDWPPAPAVNCGLFGGFGQLSGRSVSPAMLAATLSEFLGRTVVDRTGLAGTFELELKWTPDQAPRRPAGTSDPPPIDPNGPSLFTAVREQLGLKLESIRGPVDVLVIDSASPPTPD
jgi:bla regulator protein blaR1